MIFIFNLFSFLLHLYIYTKAIALVYTSSTTSIMAGVLNYIYIENYSNLIWTSDQLVLWWHMPKGQNK